MIRTVIFISGRASNMLNILKATENKVLKKIKVTLVVSDQKNAMGLSIAKEKKIPTHLLPASPFKTKLSTKIEANLVSHLKHLKTDLICLAGYMKIIKSPLLNAFEKRILNIHPSLLPLYPGLNAQKQALLDKAKQSGCTLHFVDQNIDTGQILQQKKVPILLSDTLFSLSKRILKQEHSLYIDVLKKIESGQIPLGNSKKSPKPLSPHEPN